MAQTMTFLIIHLFCVNLLSISQIRSSFASIPKGFRLKLIHIDSPHSPLYQQNLSDFQRFKKNVEISMLRASHLKNLSENGMEDSKVLRNNSIRLPLQYLRPHFTVELTLGTPPVERTLIFDTGSSLTWTQCKPCLYCFEQNQPLFDPKKSRSYKSLTKKHKLAQKYICTRFGCYYFLQYYGGQTSVGSIAMEDFIFQTSSGQSHTERGLVFGCGNYNRGILVGDIKEVTGIFGMGKEPVSFARQIGGVIEERFSYCLPTMNNRTKQSYLRFGNEARIRGGKSRTTPFFKNMQNTHYKLDLKDISVNGQRLGLKQGTFPGGCVIDSGSTVSLLHNKANSAIQMSLQRYFSKFKEVKRAIAREIPNEYLCYSFPQDFREFPNMTYHFQGADLEIPPVNLFAFVGSFGCFQIMGSKHVTLLGAYQQQNMRFVYDLKEEKLSFAPEDCSKDAD